LSEVGRKGKGEIKPWPYPKNSPSKRKKKGDIGGKMPRGRFGEMWEGHEGVHTVSPRGGR